MKLNKFKYKVLDETKKIYLNKTTEEIRIMINREFTTPVAQEDDEMKGIIIKYLKSEKMYRLKYIHSHNRQLQPETYDRYYYLVDVDEDENGAYLEYALVYDRLYEPLLRLVYILAALAAICYLIYSAKIGAMSSGAAKILAIIIGFSMIIIFKKPRESGEECRKAEDIFIKSINILK